LDVEKELSHKSKVRVRRKAEGEVENKIQETNTAPGNWLCSQQAILGKDQGLWGGLGVERVKKTTP